MITIQTDGIKRNSRKDNRQDHFFGSNLYLFISLLASVPLYLVINSFAKAVHMPDDDAMSFAITVCFITGVFTGRYLTRIWTLKLKGLPQRLIYGLSALIALCTGWLFIQAYFPVHNESILYWLSYWLPFTAISLAAGSLIKLVRAVTQNKLREAEIAAANSRNELHVLQSKLSPHFLFNTLNNMYGISITRHEKIPALLLKLSELLRYSVYDANELFVPLNDEIRYIQNYIDFETIRIGDRLVLSSVMETTGAGVKIAPLLLIVFIENAFKHSRNTADEHIFIDIELKNSDDYIRFSVKNSQDKNGAESTAVNRHSGFGLSSVRRRLELLYPGQHELKVLDKDNFYQVMLQLKVNNRINE